MRLEVLVLELLLVVVVLLFDFGRCQRRVLRRRSGLVMLALDHHTGRPPVTARRPGHNGDRRGRLRDRRTT